MCIVTNYRQLNVICINSCILRQDASKKSPRNYLKANIQDQHSKARNQILESFERRKRRCCIYLITVLLYWGFIWEIYSVSLQLYDLSRRYRKKVVSSRMNANNIFHDYWYIISWSWLYIDKRNATSNCLKCVSERMRFQNHYMYITAPAKTRSYN